jgi:hypothetical protein
MAEDMRQFKVYLPADLIREIKYLAIDTEQSLSSIAAAALRRHVRDAQPTRATRQQGGSMGTSGVEGLIVETRNWGKTVAFWQALGYQVEFETGRNSGRMRDPAGGPYLFIVERPEGPAPEIQPLVGAAGTGGFEPPAVGAVDQPFTERHWGVAEMLLRDPDGRRVSVQVPLPEGACGRAPES